MCIICIEIEKNRLTGMEASRNLSEMVDTIDEEHYDEVIEKVNDLFYKEYLEFCEFCPGNGCCCEENIET